MRRQKSSQRILFDWQHQRISSTDLKIGMTKYLTMIWLGSERIFLKLKRQEKKVVVKLKRWGGGGAGIQCAYM